MVIEDYLSQTDKTYILASSGNNQNKPIGMFSLNFNGPIVFVNSALWFDWATDIGKLSTSIHALNELRKDYVVILHNHIKDKKFYERIAQHGVIRQVGRWFDVYDTPAQVWQTRRR